jgi:hypothetical protein
VKNRETEEELIANIKKSLPELRDLERLCGDLLDEPETESSGEDGLYRFYHQSYKTYRLQDLTLKIVDQLRKLNPDGPDFRLDGYFEEIVKEGTGKHFKLGHNEDWLKHTRPIVEAFFHVRWMLEMTIKYGKTLGEPPQILPTGWAAVLTVYRLR